MLYHLALSFNLAVIYTIFTMSGFITLAGARPMDSASKTASKTISTSTSVSRAVPTLPAIMTRPVSLLINPWSETVSVHTPSATSSTSPFSVATPSTPDFVQASVSTGQKDHEEVGHGSDEAPQDVASAARAPGPERSAPSRAQSVRANLPETPPSPDQCDSPVQFRAPSYDELQPAFRRTPGADAPRRPVPAGWVPRTPMLPHIARFDDPLPVPLLSPRLDPSVGATSLLTPIDLAEQEVDDGIWLNPSPDLSDEELMLLIGPYVDREILNFVSNEGDTPVDDSLDDALESRDEPEVERPREADIPRHLMDPVTRYRNRLPNENIRLVVRSRSPLPGTANYVHYAPVVEPVDGRVLYPSRMSDERDEAIFRHIHKLSGGRISPAHVEAIIDGWIEDRWSPEYAWAPTPLQHQLDYVDAEIFRIWDEKYSWDEAKCVFAVENYLAHQALRDDPYRFDIEPTHADEVDDVPNVHANGAVTRRGAQPRIAAQAAFAAITGEEPQGQARGRHFEMDIGTERAGLQPRTRRVDSDDNYPEDLVVEVTYDALVAQRLAALEMEEQERRDGTGQAGPSVPREVRAAELAAERARADRENQVEHLTDEELYALLTGPCPFSPTVLHGPALPVTPERYNVYAQAPPAPRAAGRSRIPDSDSDDEDAESESDDNGNGKGKGKAKDKGKGKAKDSGDDSGHCPCVECADPAPPASRCSNPEPGLDICYDIDCLCVGPAVDRNAPRAPGLSDMFREAGAVPFEERYQAGADQDAEAEVIASEDEDIATDEDVQETSASDIDAAGTEDDSDYGGDRARRMRDSLAIGRRIGAVPRQPTVLYMGQLPPWEHGLNDNAELFAHDDSSMDDGPNDSGSDATGSIFMRELRRERPPGRLSHLENMEQILDTLMDPATYVTVEQQQGVSDMSSGGLITPPRQERELSDESSGSLVNHPAEDEESSDESNTSSVERDDGFSDNEFDPLHDPAVVAWGPMPPGANEAAQRPSWATPLDGAPARPLRTRPIALPALTANQPTNPDPAPAPVPSARATPDYFIQMPGMDPNVVQNAVNAGLTPVHATEDGIVQVAAEHPHRQMLVALALAAMNLMALGRARHSGDRCG